MSARDTASSAAISQTGAQPALRYLKGAVALWLGIGLVAAGSAGFVASVQAWRAARGTERAAAETQATVVGQSTATTSGANSTPYLALYRFAANASPRIEGSQEPPLETCERVARRERLAVCYLPADPADAPARPGVPQWMWPLLTGITGALAVLGVLLTRPAVRRLQTIRSVQHSGVDARATVIDVAPIYTRRDRASHWRVRYEFADGLGRSYAGNSEPMSPEEASHWRVDDSVAVRFDPQAPHQNCWLGTRVGA